MLHINCPMSKCITPMLILKVLYSDSSKTKKSPQFNREHFSDILYKRYSTLQSFNVRKKYKSFFFYFGVVQSHVRLFKQIAEIFCILRKKRYAYTVST